MAPSSLTDEQISLIQQRYKELYNKEISCKNPDYFITKTGYLAVRSDIFHSPFFMIGQDGTVKQHDTKQRKEKKKAQEEALKGEHATPDEIELIKDVYQKIFGKAPSNFHKKIYRNTHGNICYYLTNKNLALTIKPDGTLIHLSKKGMPETLAEKEVKKRREEAKLYYQKYIVEHSDKFIPNHLNRYFTSVDIKYLKNKRIEFYFNAAQGAPFNRSQVNTTTEYTESNFSAHINEVHALLAKHLNINGDIYNDLAQKIRSYIITQLKKQNISPLDIDATLSITDKSFLPKAIRNKCNTIHAFLAVSGRDFKREPMSDSFDLCGEVNGLEYTYNILSRNFIIRKEPKLALKEIRARKRKISQYIERMEYFIKYFNPKEFNASYDSDTDAIVFSLKNDPAEPISVPLAASYKALINRYYKVVAQYRQKERDRVIEKTVKECEEFGDILTHAILTEISTNEKHIIKAEIVKQLRGLSSSSSYHYKECEYTGKFSALSSDFVIERIEALQKANFFNTKWINGEYAYYEIFRLSDLGSNMLVAIPARKKKKFSEYSEFQYLEYFKKFKVPDEIPIKKASELFQIFVDHPSLYCMEPSCIRNIIAHFPPQIKEAIKNMSKFEDIPWKKRYLKALIS